MQRREFAGIDSNKELSLSSGTDARFISDHETSMQMHIVLMPWKDPIASIRYGFTETPFGIGCIGMLAEGICYLSFFDNDDVDPAVRELKFKWPDATLERDDESASNWRAQIFRQDSHRHFKDGFSQRKPLCLYVRGTPFQRRVWQILTQIPNGYIMSYGQIAHRLGLPNAARAVGSAVGQNTIAYLIPCHRVVRGSGAIGGFRWGIDRKKLLLSWEASARVQESWG